MPFDNYAPDMPPDTDAAPAVARGTRFRLRLEAALLNRRLLGGILLIVLVGLVARTLLFARETPTRRALSDLYMDAYEALSATKSAYTPGLILPPSAPDSGSIPPASTSSPIGGKKKPSEAVSRLAGRNDGSPSTAANARPSRPAAISPSHAVSKPRKLAQVRGEQAVEKWQDTVRSKQARAAEWRRMGIVLALFHRPGALEALAHVGDTFPPIPTSRSKRATMGTENANIDPLGHGRTGVAVSEEIKVWQALYGPQALSSTQVPALRVTLQQLHLGWFENVVLAQLYEKAGLHSQAAQAANAADRTARNVRTLENVQMESVLFGFIGLFLCCVFALIRLFQPTHKRFDAEAAPPFAAQRATPPSPTSTRISNQTDVAQKTEARSDKRFLTGITTAPPEFIAAALLLAFIIYLVGHTSFGLLTGYALLPFSARLDALNTTQLLRLNFVLQLLLYVPVFLLPLWILRTRLISYQRSSALLEPLEPSKLSLSLWALLTHLGYRTRNAFAEIRSSISAYLLLMPGLILAGLISHALFHRFHTQVNPAQFETMAARQMLDKILIFALAAVVAPIVEETMFRGLLYSALRDRFGVLGAAMLSAAIFSLVHPTLPGGFLTIWAIGIALALVYERRGSLMPGIILHGIHNGLITLLGFAVFGN